MKIRKILIKNIIIILFILIFFINCTKKINNKNLEKRKVYKLWNRFRKCKR